MKKVAIAVAGFAIFTVVLIRCDMVIGGPPVGVRIEAADQSDSTVMISWTAPSEGTPDIYLVYFKGVGEHSYTPVAETDKSSFVHNPHGVTGVYKVMARFGAKTYEAFLKPSTVPVYTDSVILAELNASGNSGYGWSASSGRASTYSMLEEASADYVDLYITDFVQGLSGPVYSVASPDYGPTDPGDSVPTAAWHVTGFTEGLQYEQGLLPSYDETVYLDYQEITTVPICFGCYTEDGYYAMVKVDTVNTFTGEVRVRSWFQLIGGLRLIRH